MMKMSKSLFLAAGAALFFTLGTVAVNNSAGAGEEGGTMTGDEGGAPADVDQKRDAAAAESGTERSSEGEATQESNTLKSAGEQQKTAVEKAPAGTTEEGDGDAGGAPQDAPRDSN